MALSQREHEGTFSVTPEGFPYYTDKERVFNDPSRDFWQYRGRRQFMA